MDCTFFEASNGPNWGKFMVGRFTGDDWDHRSTVTGWSLIRNEGWGQEHLLVLDLATGEGALLAVRSNGIARADLDKHQIWVCPMFEPFLQWLYAQDVTDLAALPHLVELPEVPFAAAGYRRSRT